MATSYQTDIVAWASEQARMVRAGRFDLLDLEHIAEEIEDVGKNEQRELANRMAVLLAHLLKWQFQPERQGNSWRNAIRAQRKEVTYLLDEAPSLRAKLIEARWLDMVWAKAVAQAGEESGLETWPEVMPWTIDEVLKREVAELDDLALRPGRAYEQLPGDSASIRSRSFRKRILDPQRTVDEQTILHVFGEQRLAASG